MVDPLRFFDEAAFATEVDALDVEAEGLAEDAQGAVIGVQRAVDDGGDQPLWVVLTEGLFDDALAGAGVADDEAKAALLAVHTQRFEDFTLGCEQLAAVVLEGVLVEAEVCPDHDVRPLGLRSLAWKSTWWARPMRSPL